MRQGSKFRKVPELEVSLETSGADPKDLKKRLDRAVRKGSGGFLGRVPRFRVHAVGRIRGFQEERLLEVPFELPSASDPNFSAVGDSTWADVVLQKWLVAAYPRSRQAVRLVWKQLPCQKARCLQGRPCGALALK